MSIEGPQVETSADVPDVAAAPAADTLDIGTAPNPRRRIRLILAAVALVVLVAGLLTWQLWPRPPAPLTQAELQGVYAGMVRSDGTNDATKISQAKQSTSSVQPAACAPLFDMIGSGLLPGASDGMATYWLGANTATAMTTHRYADAAAALQEYTVAEQALPNCLAPTISTETGTQATLRTVTTASIPDSRQLGYAMTITSAGSDGTGQHFVVRLIAFQNTVTVIYRLDPTGTGAADSLPDDRLATSLLAQMNSVIDLRNQ